MMHVCPAADGNGMSEWILTAAYLLLVVLLLPLKRLLVTTACLLQLVLSRWWCNTQLLTGTGQQEHEIRERQWKQS